MNHHYEDIRDRIEDSPAWFDEHAVPRYCDFAPNKVANIYADEAVLFRVQCQSCMRRFAVAMSASSTDEIRARISGHRYSTIADLIRADALEYGDPPNVNCCPSGPTMNSIPLRVLEYWKRTDGQLGRNWTRDASLERELGCEWVKVQP